MPDADPLPTDLSPAAPNEITEALAYALCHDSSGKSRRGGWDFVAKIAAEHLTQHLARSGFVIMRKAKPKSHSTD